jgi:hypothetical protein
MSDRRTLLRQKIMDIYFLWRYSTFVHLGVTWSVWNSSLRAPIYTSEVNNSITLITLVQAFKFDNSSFFHAHARTQPFLSQNLAQKWWSPGQRQTELSFAQSVHILPLHRSPSETHILSPSSQKIWMNLNRIKNNSLPRQIWIMFQDEFDYH